MRYSRGVQTRPTKAPIQQGFLPYQVGLQVKAAVYLIGTEILAGLWASQDWAGHPWGSERNTGRWREQRK